MGKDMMQIDLGWGYKGMGLGWDSVYKLLKVQF